MDIKNKTIRANVPVAKTVERTVAHKTPATKSIVASTKVQTAEGWKRDMRKQHSKKDA